MCSNNVFFIYSNLYHIKEWFVRSPTVGTYTLIVQMCAKSRVGYLPQEACTIGHKGTKGFIWCLFKAVSLAMLNKQILSPCATDDALSLVITKLSSFGLAPKVLKYVKP